MQTVINEHSSEIYFVFNEEISFDEIKEMQINEILNNEKFLQDLVKFHQNFHEEIIDEEVFKEEMILMIIEDNFIFDYYFEKKLIFS